MISLSKLNPKWIGVLRQNSGEGVSFDCPVCGPKHSLAAYFSNPLDGLPHAEWQKPLWVRDGDTLETLSVEPSIQYGCFHGWVENGKTFDVSESPLTFLGVVNGNPQLISTSPKQALTIAEQVLKQAKSMLE